MIRRNTVWLLALILFGCSLHYRPWPRAEELISAGDCGLTAAEVSTLARRFGVDRVSSHDIRGPSGTTEFVAIKGGTHVTFGFLDSKLRYGYFTWTSGFMYVSRAMATDYCTGQAVVKVNVDIAESIGRAELSIDGEDVGTIRWPYPRSFYVSTGTHTIRVSRDGIAAEKTVSYTPDGPTRDFVKFQLIAEREPGNA